MKLTPLGFFRELRHGHTHGPSLHAAVRREPQPDEKLLIQYLTNGVLVTFCPGVASDVLDDAGALSAPPHTLTDGTWYWPGDLPYYVERYHAVVPAEFRQHCVARSWRVPREEDIDLVAVEECLESMVLEQG